MKKHAKLPARIFINFVNGNLTAAQKTAKRVKTGDLIDFAHNEIGWNINLSMASANYLKGLISFHNFCKIKEKENFSA
jgi:hypothetical protein